jgi:hypothetical protein
LDASLEERDIIYLISMAIVSKLRVDPDHMIRLNVGDLARKIVERLRAPAVECAFCVPVSTGRGLQLALNIDGPKKLKIQKPGIKSGEAIALCGSVNAIHEYHAARQIEADVKSVLGVLISMRIAQPLPIPVYEIPLITFQNRPALLSAEATPHPVIAIPLDPMVGGLASRIQFSVPDDLNELEMKRFGTGEDPNPSLERRLRGLVTLLTNDSERTRELRSAAALLFDAFAAPEPGKAIALAFMSMEAVLLDAKTTESIVARLSEAVAYRLGTSAEQRTELRKRVSNCIRQGRVLYILAKLINHRPPSAKLVTWRPQCSAEKLRISIPRLRVSLWARARISETVE